MTANRRHTKQRATAMDIRPVRSPRLKPSNKSAAVKPAAISIVSKKTPQITNDASKKNSLINRLFNHPLKNHPFAVPVATFVVLSFVSMIAFVVSNGSTVGASDTRLVNITIDGEERVIPTRAKTVKDFLERIDVAVNDKDIVEPSLDTEIIDNDFSINMYKARTVTVVDGETEETIVTAVPTARGVAKEAGMSVYPEDKVETHVRVVETEDVLRGEPVAEVIVIDRATPINLNLFGSTYRIRTHAKTVGELAKEKGFESASTFPSTDALLENNQSVFITDKNKKITVTEELIDFATERVDDLSLEKGTTQVKEIGKPGKKAVIYEISEDGTKMPLQELIIEQPSKEIIAVGKKLINRNVSQYKQDIMIAAGISPEDFTFVDFIITKESGWNLAARNSGGCLGLGQACPGSKLTNVCPNYDTDAVCQMKFFNGYAQTCVSYRKYCGWEGAYTFWTLHRWW